MDDPIQRTTPVSKKATLWNTIYAIVGTLLGAAGGYTGSAITTETRTGTELWAINLATGQIDAVESSELQSGDLILSVEWAGEGRDISSIEMYQFEKRNFDLTPKLEEEPPTE